MSSMLILKQARVIDPSADRDEITDIWISDGKIIAPQDDEPDSAAVYNLAGMWVVPGLIDMHVHLREPGLEYKETIESGTRAAAAGGFTAVACMPNTTPVNDCASITKYILEKATGCQTRVYPVGTVSKGGKGESLAEIGEMRQAGIVAVTDDGMPVSDSQLMRRALEYTKSHGVFVMSHSEDLALSRSGCMNEGVTSTRLGLKGIPAAAESVMVYRDAALAEFTGGRVHVSHVSCAESVDVIRRAKERGVAVTAETAPHYFTLTEEAVVGYDTNAKMNPPLRGQEDREALRMALQDGTIDAIATDHAPHSVLEKELEFNLAANGITGLETSLPLTLELVREGVISEKRLVELMSCSPARILDVPGGTLKVGSVADITVIDPDEEYTFTAEMSLSKGKNSPFMGRQLKGRAVMTLVAGKVQLSRLKRDSA